MRFDYLRPEPHAIVQLVFRFKLPERYRAVAIVLCAAAAAIACAWSIEAYRLQEALKMESVYRVQYEDAHAALLKANVFYARVRRLTELDSRVQRIVASGHADARTLAEIANALPAHAWLTAISHDGSGYVLQGRAQDLSVLSAVLHGLMHSAHLHDPTLVDTALEDAAGGSPMMKYDIHVQAEGA